MSVDWSFHGGADRDGAAAATESFESEGKTLLAVRREDSAADMAGRERRLWVHSADVDTAPTPVSEAEFAELCRRCDYCAVAVVVG